MNVTVCIPTCVYPLGCKRLLESIASGTDFPFRMIVLMDGCKDWQPLYAMEEYAQRFAGKDKCVPGHPTDKQRLVEANEDTQDYSFLEHYEKRWDMMVLRNETNINAVPTFNRLLALSRQADVSVLVMDDEEVKPGWLKWQVEVFRSFPNVVVSGYGNRFVEGTPVFSDLPEEDDLASALFYRGSYVRSMFNRRGWFFPEAFKMVNGDGWLLNEAQHEGHDLGIVAEPHLACSRGHHKSLGNWQWDNIMADRQAVRDGAMNMPHLPECEQPHEYWNKSRRVAIRMHTDRPEVKEIRRE